MLSAYLECVRGGAERSGGVLRSNEEFTASLYTREVSSTQPGPFSCHYVVRVVNYSRKDVVVLSENPDNNEEGGKKKEQIIICKIFNEMMLYQSSLCDLFQTNEL